MQSIIVFLGIALIFSVILSNFLECANKNKGNDFTFKEYIKDFKIKNIDFKYTLVFFILFEILSKVVPVLDLIVYIPITFALILTFCLDIKYMIIPDTSSIIILVSGILKLILNFSVENCINSLIGLVIGGIFFYIINVIFEFFTKQIGFGMGDIKILACLGLFFGYKNIIVIILLSIFISAVISIVFLIVNYLKNIKEEYLPFGPFIVISTFIICLIPGEKIIAAYFSMIDYLVALVI